MNEDIPVITIEFLVNGVSIDESGDVVQYEDIMKTAYKFFRQDERDTADIIKKMIDYINSGNKDEETDIFNSLEDAMDMHRLIKPVQKNLLYGLGCGLITLLVIIANAIGWIDFSILPIIFMGIISLVPILFAIIDINKYRNMCNSSVTLTDVEYKMMVNIMFVIIYIYLEN